MAPLSAPHVGLETPVATASPASLLPLAWSGAGRAGKEFLAFAGTVDRYSLQVRSIQVGSPGMVTGMTSAGQPTLLGSLVRTVATEFQDSGPIITGTGCLPDQCPITDMAATMVLGEYLAQHPRSCRAPLTYDQILEGLIAEPPTAEHPYRGMWALPGRLTRADATRIRNVIVRPRSKNEDAYCLMIRPITTTIYWVEIDPLCPPPCCHRYSMTWNLWYLEDAGIVKIKGTDEWGMKVPDLSEGNPGVPLSWVRAGTGSGRRKDEGCLRPGQPPLPPSHGIVR